MEKLKNELDELIDRLENTGDFRKEVAELYSVFPFNEYEYVISHLLVRGKFTLREYYDLRRSYIDRNLYLSIFEISSPRGLGDGWARGQLMQLVPEFRLPSKELDADYSNQYDLWLPLAGKSGVYRGVRIEIKASRAVDVDKPHEPLYIKALSADSNKKFDISR
ncbi:MAG: hypothetical protein HY894_01540 [Deltaproteobacteria bacterium]|nr:hypothetical protein [Deltaproteobacteria bacterium]